MTLAAAVFPLAAYAVVFQTVLYLVLPTRLRTRVAPVVTGLIGAAVVVVAGIWFGFERIGIAGGNPATALAWGMAAVVVTSVVGFGMARCSDTRGHLTDPRVTELSDRQLAVQIFVRIPVFTALIEEAVFRGVLHAALIAIYPPTMALWLGAGLFGLWHIGPGLDQAVAGEKSRTGTATHTLATVVATTMAGAFLVWLRMETGSIWASVAVHAAMNMTMALFAVRTARRTAAKA